jgi:hypothetical protein
MIPPTMYESSNFSNSLLTLAVIFENRAMLLDVSCVYLMVGWMHFLMISDVCFHLFTANTYCHFYIFFG